jgi:hypothetical protein
LVKFKKSREDVVLYIETWAKILRENWIYESEISLELALEKKLKLPVLV